jgi:Flp pilus assembly CpaE family ATPase
MKARVTITLKPGVLDPQGRAIQNALGQPVEAVVHNDFPLVERALNLGSLLADVKPGARATRDIEALTHHYAGIPDAPVAAGGFFSRLLGGR